MMSITISNMTHTLIKDKTLHSTDFIYPIIMNNIFFKHAQLLTLIGMLCFGGNSDIFGALSFINTTKDVIKITPEKSTGLNDIFVVFNTDNISLKYTSEYNNTQVKWYSFSNLGASFSEPILDIDFENNVSILNHITPDCGYIIEDNNNRYYFWIIDYHNKYFQIQSLLPSDNQSCEATTLSFDGQCDPLKYYTINGRAETLSRDIVIDYYSLIFDNEKEQYVEIPLQKTFTNISNEIVLTPPVYCSTNFRISGDRFLKQWGLDLSFESPILQPIATSVTTTATPIVNDDNETENSNQIKDGNDGLGGSAPCDIEFKAFVSDAVIHNEWQMANDEDFNDITYRIQEQDMSYTFTHEGTTFVRFVGSNSDGSCESIGDAYKIIIGNSKLEIPNAFSPNGDGVNDEWKVSYRSLIDFQCWIFDRNGHEIYHFKDPSMGWDGRRGGKPVKPGVYYYVINATGADNIKYKKSGDINIVTSIINNSSNKE